MAVRWQHALQMFRGLLFPADRLNKDEELVTFRLECLGKLLVYIYSQSEFLSEIPSQEKENSTFEIDGVSTNSKSPLASNRNPTISPLFYPSEKSSME